MKLARGSLALAVLLLLLGSAYGVVASETPERVDRWNGPGRPAVVSGYCSREYRLLPTRSSRPPDFIRFGERTYIRAGTEVKRPRGVQDTNHWRGAWRLGRSRDRLFLETVGKSTWLPYERGECPVKHTSGMLLPTVLASWEPDLAGSLLEMDLRVAVGGRAEVRGAWG